MVAQIEDSVVLAGPTRRAPITDVLSLELASGSDEGADWARPVTIHAVILTGRDAVRAVQRVSRWASYAARVAIVPADRVSDHVLAEASLRGVWLVGAVAGEQPRVLSSGETGPTPGASRGLLHRLLDELVLATLIQARATRTVKTA